MSLLHMKIIKKKENKRKNRLMLNIEKYKDNIEKHINVCGLYREIYKIKNREYAHDCCENCDECYDRCIRWLAEEYKEPVLDEVEREYLSAVIKPFRKKVVYIKKNKNSSNGMQYLTIVICDDDYMYFPYIDDDAMYKGMEVNKEYSLEELDL